MDSQVSPLILTKLRVPTVRSRLVTRTRLLEQLSSGSGANLTLVCAPAGYGKTTLLAEWAQCLLQNGTAVAWVALDSSDDAPASFGAYLVAGFIHALGPAPELARIAHLLRSTPEVDMHRLLPALINALASDDHNCVLILDDYHLIGAPAIHSALAFLLEHMPENLRIVLGTRSDPPLPLARLRARGQLLELRSAELRFLADETAQFFSQVMRLNLPPQVVAALEGRTEGWIAGLQLAALSLAGRLEGESFLSSFSGSHRYLVDYLLEEVFNRQPEQVRAFLLSTSILERLSAPLCDAISGSLSLSRPILEQLEQANLFVVALDDQGEWYRYHHLFRDFLRLLLQKTQPERAAVLHRLASDWYASHGFPREAVQHAFQTADWDYAAQVVEQHSFTMLIHSELSTIYEWCSAFPEQVMQTHPLLCILQCWALVLSFRRQYLGMVEARLRQAAQAIAALEDRQLASQLMEHAAVVRTFLAMVPDPMADPGAQLNIAQDMLGVYPEGEPARVSALFMSGYCHMALHDSQSALKEIEEARQLALQGNLYYGIVESTYHLASLLHNQGRLQSAVDICRQSQADLAAMLAHPEQDLPAVGCLDIALGCVLLEQDNLEEAERLLLHGLGLIGGGMPPYYLMAACVALYRLRQFQGRPAEAVAFLARLEDAWPDIAFCTQGLRLLNALRVEPGAPSTLAEAAAWSLEYSPAIGVGDPSPGLGPFGAAGVYYLAGLTWARVRIALGEAQAVLSYLERQLDLASTHGLTTRLIELSLLEALARDAVHEADLAWESLARALAAGQPAGYLRIFDQGAALNRLLAEAARRGICQGKYRAYIEHILAAVLPQTQEAARVAPASSLESGEQLSDRELEVLRLMARGASNRDIAGQLVITVGTVKSHVNHILVKLACRNRTEAVAMARELGLLEI